MSEQHLKLTGRHYKTVPLDKAGYEEAEFQLDPDKTALVGMHLLNMGLEDGPAVDNNYFVGMGFAQTCELAEEILKNKIKPAMDAARQANVLVCHVEMPHIGRKHPDARIDEDPPQEIPEVKLAVPGWLDHIMEVKHGKDFRNKGPYPLMDHAKICEPREKDLRVYQTHQFDRALRKKGIENLIYTGYATDMCVLYAQGGVSRMLGQGYRVFLLRDATVGVEFPDTVKERKCTFWGLRQFEAQYGYTFTTEDFIKNCKSLS